jgi:glycosyltransferase involved in cell wall biosynthesis
VRIAWINELATLTGGAERYVTETAALLAKDGVASTLFYDVRSRIAPEATLPFDGVFPIVQLAAQLRELQPDVVFVHQVADERVVEDAVRSGLPVVRFLHDHRLLCLREHKYTALGETTCEAAPGLGCYACLGFVRREPRTRGLSLVTLGGLRRRIAAHAALPAVVVGSAYMREQAEKAGMPGERLHVVRLYAAAPAEGAPELARDPRLLLAVGALTTGKGIDVLLEALARARPDARLLLIGDGPQRAKLEQQARELGLAARVTFAGRMAHADVVEAYQRAACVVMPSRQPESFGLVGVEAMSHGTPVIASRAGGASEWLRDEETGLAVPPCDAPALAAAVDRLLAAPELASRLGAAGRRAHRARFLPEHHARGLLEVLTRVAQRRAA